MLPFVSLRMCKNISEKRTRKCPICRTRITWNLEQINKHIKLSKEKFSN